MPIIPSKNPQINILVRFLSSWYPECDDGGAIGYLQASASKESAVTTVGIYLEHRWAECQKSQKFKLQGTVPSTPQR